MTTGAWRLTCNTLVSFVVRPCNTVFNSVSAWRVSSGVGQRPFANSSSRQETKSFTPSDKARTSPLGIFLVSPATTVTERFRRISHEEMNYRFTVEDPNWYERPWTGETHFMLSEERVLEAACHEGNYTIRFMLEAARTLEAAR